MKRYHVVLRLGKEDKQAIIVSDPDAVVREVPMFDPLGSLDFGFYEFTDAIRRESLHPSEVALDLVMLATAVFGADMRISRAQHSQDGWAREIHLHVPVSNVALWNSQLPSLIRALNFLSGDKWAVTFRSRPDASKAMVPLPKEMNLGNHTAVSLLSGGLDSFIGAVNLLSAGEKPFFVSHYSPSSSGYQQAVLVELEKKFGAGTYTHLKARNAFPREVIADGGDEDSTRTRSFLFFALAVYVANGFGRPMQVLVPENGFIALNVPLDPLRLGALSTRTAHPFYMARWNDFLAGLGLKVILHNPYATKTKGEMVKKCLDRRFLAKVTPKTMSCASPGKFRFVGDPWQHCGYCLPCLIRQSSLLAGLGPGKDTTVYHRAVGGSTLNTLKAEGEHVRAFQFAAARLKARPSLARLAIHKPGPLTDVVDQHKDLEKVYVNGMAEIEKLLATTKTRPGGKQSS